MGFLIILGLPLAIYLSLALLAPGRPAAIGLAVALALTGITMFLQTGGDGLGQLALIGVAMAAFAQGFRGLLGARLPHRLYLLLLGLPPLVLALILSLSLGA